MEYELAKQLKDAGFPQTDQHFYYSAHTNPPTRWDINVIDAGQRVEDEVAAPTLEELIAACGEDFIWLRKEGSDWSAHGDVIGQADSFDGPTPTQAVARLFLALNSK